MKDYTPVQVPHDSAVSPAASLSAADAASARAVARLEGRPVEVMAERTEFGSVFALPDGTMASGTGSGPVWVRQGGDGTAAQDWAPVDLTLQADDDGTVRPVAHVGDLTFSGAAEGGEGAQVELAATTDPATGITTRVSWEGDLPKPRLEGRRAVYADVEPGVDLVLEATSTGFEQFFVLQERPPAGEAPQFPLSIAAQGARVSARDDGGLTVLDDAGAVVATSTAPLMWDAQSDGGRAHPVTQPRPAEAQTAPRLSPMPAWVLEEDHGRATTDQASAERVDPDLDVPPAEPVGDLSLDVGAGSVEVARVVEQPSVDVAEVTMTPQVEFLQDPDTVYPVVIDPPVNLAWGFDTYVMKGFGDPRSGHGDMHVGTYDGGAHVGRAFLHFATDSFAGAQVSAARLELYNYYSWSCQARGWQVWSASPANAGTVWANQPPLWGHYASSSDTRGYSSGCPGGWANADVTSLAQAWAGQGAPEGYVAITAANEYDNYGWKKFLASDNGAYVPSIWVTYNFAPEMPTGLTVSGSPNGTVSGAWTSTTEPTVSFTASDRDGQPLSYRVDVRDGTGTVTPVLGAGEVASGSVASVRLPAGLLRDASAYQIRAVTGDGALLSPATPWFNLGVDVVAPAAPTVTSASFPSSTAWSSEPNVEGTFTVAMPVDESVTAYRWALDKAPDATQQVAAVSGALAELKLTPKDAGRHVLQVQAVDRAGNVSGVTKYVFRVGQGGIVAPEEGARVVRQVRLYVEGKSDLTHLSFEWRRGPDATDVLEVPASNLRTSGGAAWSSRWQPMPGPGSYSTWDVGAQLGEFGGPAQVRARLSSSPTGAGSTPTQWVTVVVDADADGASSTTIGPGAVNLLTGDHTLSVTDAEEFGLSLVRTTSSRDTDSGYELQPNGLTKEQQEATTTAGHAGSATLSIDTTRFHSGTSSYKITPQQWSDSYVGVGGDLGGMRASMRAGRSYRAGAWIYVPSSSGLTTEDHRGLSLAVYARVAGEYQHLGRTAAATAVDTWQQLSIDVAIPAGATEAFVRLYNGHSSASKPVYFDDVTIQELWSPFGPEWSLGAIDGTSGTAYTRITKPYDDVAAVEVTGGGQIWFTEGSAGAWWPEPGAESLTLTPTSPTSWRLTELDGTVTEFARDGATGDFLVRSSSPPGAVGAVRSVYDVATVPGVSRLARLIAPIEPGVDGWVDGRTGNLQACTTPTPARGCEVMELEYATTTTAAGSALGSFTGRVSGASVWTWNGTAMVKVPVASYTYDTTGRLRQVHDPRLVAAGSQAQVTAYTYDSAGRIATAQAPGEQPYRYTYGAAGTTKTGAVDFVDAAPGRLLQVTRASLVPGTKSQLGPDNTTTVVYGVPLTRAAGGPYDLDETATATWWQHDGPTDATAVFGPLDAPGVTSATATTPGRDGYRPATVHYLNASGLEVNTASPAAKNAPVEGFIDTTEYDARGNAVRTLDATNRLLALRKLPDASTSLAAWGLETRTGVELAQLLDTRTTYSEDGLDVLSTLSPVQRLAVANDANDVRLLRARTRNVYDEGKPDGAQYHLLTTTTSDGVELSGQAFDPIITQNAYAPVDGADPLGPTSGWVHKQATRVTVDAGQPSALSSSVVYDARGRVLRSSKPGSSGTDAATTVAVFYTAGPNPEDGACANRPEWAGQPCVTRAAGAVTGHDPARMSTELPVKRVEGYNAFGSPTLVTESVGSGAGLVTRTSTTTYDAADRVVTVKLTGTGTGVGEGIATTRTTYDPVTGDVVKNASLNAAGAEIKAISKEYDALGRLIKYTDSTGAWTTTTYDRLGQPQTVTDSIGTTRTYTYDRAAEPRGFVTKLSDSVAGDVVPTWGPDGQLESQTLPGGVRLSIGYDTARVPVARTYTRVSDGVVIAADAVVENHRGQWISHTSADLGTHTYTYDRLGRLTGADQRITATDTCTSRRYGFDQRSNRTTLSTATGAAGAACPGGAGAAVTTSTYDAADRLVSTSGGNGQAWTYDALGRTTAMPTADGTGVATTGYFVNDLIASQEVPGVEKATWTLDPLHRFATQNTFAWVNGAWANSTEQVIHYDGDGDEPAWIVEDKTQPDKVSRWVEGADGNSAVQTGKTGDRVLQLVDLHGDIVATLPIADGATTATWAGLQLTSFDEFGVPTPMAGAATSNAPPARYGWLGAAQRSADTPAGVLLMGVRLYHPTTGRFLQVDPVAGGSANAYDYCNADPVNCTDLDGRWPAWGKALGVVAAVGEFASMIPGPAGAVAGAIAAGAYTLKGDHEAAAWAAAGAAAALVGLGTAVRVARVTKAANAFHRGIPGAAASIKASRPIAAIAGRVHVRAVRLEGKYKATLKNGKPYLSRGSGATARSYRPVHRTPSYGWRSNLDVGVGNVSVKGKPSYRSFHVTHRSRYF